MSLPSVLTPVNLKEYQSCQNRCALIAIQKGLGLRDVKRIGRRQGEQISAGIMVVVDRSSQSRLNGMFRTQPHQTPVTFERSPGELR